MVKIDLTPTYRGIWISSDKFNIFSMWKKEKKNWKILEKYEGGLIEADAKILLNDGIQIEFIKKYKTHFGDSLMTDITYFGRGNGIGFYDGKWKGKNIEGELIRGEFYLVDVKEDWAVKELEKIIGRLHLRDFDLRVRDLQR